jgi:sarcosine oxidase subunit gamma
MDGPLDHSRRTPLWRLLEAEQAGWRTMRDTVIAETVGDGEAARTLGIADLSPLPRIGFKGRGTIEAMKKRGVTVEPIPNRAFRQPDGGLCLVLAPGEVILLSNLAGDGAKLSDMVNGWRIEDEERTYPLLRRDSHAWFAVTGTAAPALFAKLCAIDLRPETFLDLAIAQTSIAKMSAILVRSDIGATLVYHVLADSAAALYFCSCLTDAAAEFCGEIVGVRAVQELEGS